VGGIRGEGAPRAFIFRCYAGPPAANSAGPVCAKHIK